MTGVAFHRHRAVAGRTAHHVLRMPQAFVVLQRCITGDVAILASRVLEDRSNEVERSQCAIRGLRADGSAREYQRSACNK